MMVLGFKDTKSDPLFIARWAQSPDVGTVLAAAVAAKPELPFWDVLPDDDNKEGLES